MTGRVLCAVGILAACIALAAAQDKSDPTSKANESPVKLNPAPAGARTYHWKMVDKDGEQERGTVSHAVTVETKELQPGVKTDVLTVAEKFSMKRGDKEAGYEATVRYALGAKPVPISAECKTVIDGKEIMTGEVKFSEKTAAVTGSLKADKHGNPLDPPKGIKHDMNRPAGLVVFYNVLAAAPRLMAEPGEVKDVVVAEFPDDINEALNLKEGYTLARAKPQADGSFEMTVTDPRGETAWRGYFDAKGTCLRMELGDRKLTPAKPPASGPAAAPADPSRAVDKPALRPGSPG